VPKKKGGGEQKQGPPIQFRPGVELEQLLSGFAARHNLPRNDAAKILVALAISELDCRFYPLIHQMSQAMGEGPNAIARSCDYIRISLEAGRRATGHPLQLDPERSWFIVETVRDFVAGKGLPVEGVRLAFLPEGEDLAASQHGQESVHEGVGQQETQPAGLAGSGTAKKARRILYKHVVDEARSKLAQRQVPDEAIEDQPETPERAPSEGARKTPPDPAR
jgi:hypothetical protein